MTARKRNSGFTLVEILIVVVILGILAAIVIPQFTAASESAKSSNLTSQLQTVRSQLELYQVQHNGNYPALADMWTNLIEKTDVNGSTTGTDDYGPYLQKAPINPFENSSTVVANGSAAATKGWTYNATTGAIKAVVKASVKTELNLSDSDVETYAGS